MSNSSKSSKKAKPAKPYKDFPLFPHQSGQWCKKIRGRNFYFGCWDDWKVALESYQSQREYIRLHGEKPTATPVGVAGVGVRQLCNEFLTAKNESLETGQISQRSFNDYLNTGKRLVRVFGPDRKVSTLGPADFDILRADLNKTLSNRSVANEIGRIRMFFKFGVDQDLLTSLPKYGQGFNKPSALVIRRERRAKPKKLFSPEELRTVIDAAGQPLKAMILLGINSGMGNSDIARIEYSHINFETRWVDYPRHKTEVERRFPMWPETIEALNEAIAFRPKGGHTDQVFCTRKGLSWFKEDSSTNPISQAFSKHLNSLDLKRPSVGFYSLRHSFETLGGDSGDQVAVDSIMGHVDSSMASHYREKIADERLVTVTEFVRRKIFKEST